MPVKKKVEEKKEECCTPKVACKPSGACEGSAVYGFGFLGAAYFYIQHADTFWVGCLGVLKAIIWPAMLVHKLLEFLK